MGVRVEYEFRAHAPRGLNDMAVGRTVAAPRGHFQKHAVIGGYPGLAGGYQSRVGKYIDVLT